MSKLEQFKKQLQDIASKSKIAESKTGLSETQDYIYAHRNELLEQCPEQWIAVYKKKIVGNHKNVIFLVRELRASGIPLQQVVLEKLSREETPLAL